MIFYIVYYNINLLCFVCLFFPYMHTFQGGLCDSDQMWSYHGPSGSEIDRKKYFWFWFCYHVFQPTTPTKPVVFADWICGVSPPDPETINKHVHNMVEVGNSHSRHMAVMSVFMSPTCQYVTDTVLVFFVMSHALLSCFLRSPCVANTLVTSLTCLSVCHQYCHRVTDITQLYYWHVM